MAYCKISDITPAWVEEEDLVGLCSRELEATISSPTVTAVLNSRIELAGSMIDSYLIGRYGSQLRTEEAISVLKHKCAELAVYLLYLRRRAVDEDWQSNHEDMIAWLTDLRDGKGDLLASEETGEALEEPVSFIQHDAEILKDSDLLTNDRRNYTPSKQQKLFGVGPNEH